MSNPLRIHLIDFPPSWIVPFKGEHPDVIQRLKQEIGYGENSAVDFFLENKWEVYANIGEYICDISVKRSRSDINKYYAALLLLRKLLFPTDSRKLNADLTIIRSAAKMINSN